MSKPEVTNEARTIKRAEDCIYVNHSVYCKCNKTNVVVKFGQHKKPRTRG